MLSLTVAKGPDRGSVFELRSPARVVIGRNSPDLKLNDIMISRYHARIKHEGGKWTVRDLGSRNGTQLNGERLKAPAVLKTGDRIVTGYTEFEVTLHADEVATPSSKFGPAAVQVKAAGGSPVETVARPAASANATDALASLALAASAGTSEAVTLPDAGATDGDLDAHDSGSDLGTSSGAIAQAAATAPALSERRVEEIELADQPAVPAPKLNGNGRANGNGHAHVEAAAKVELARTPVSESVVPHIESADDTNRPPIAAEVEIEASCEIAPAPHAIEAVVAETVPSLPPAVITAPPQREHATFADVMTDVATNVTEKHGVASLVPPAETTPAAQLTTNLAAPAPAAASESERAASEWMSAIESQLVVAEAQGWDDNESDDDEAFIAAALATDEVQPLDELQRSMLYLDEDEHWADDVQVDDEELIASLKEDGPSALLAEVAAAVATPAPAKAGAMASSDNSKSTATTAPAEPTRSNGNHSGNGHGKSKRRRKR